MQPDFATRLCAIAALNASIGYIPAAEAEANF